MSQLTIEQAFDLAVQHHQAGQLGVAEQLYRQVLAQQPRNVDALHMLGVTACQAGRNDIAADLIRRAIALRPNLPEAHYNLGVVLIANGDLDEAVAAYRQAITLKPNYFEAHSNLGNALRSKGHMDEAVAAYRQAITVMPDYAEAHFNLARILRTTQPDEARQEYEEAVRLRPDADAWRFELAAHIGDNSVRTAPPDYVRGLFDTYAPGFEEHLVETLQYRAPQEMLAAVLAAGPKRFFDAIDLGCGTGLCGEQFKPYCRHLVGVDLSPRMIQAAKARQIYDELYVSDILVPLRAQVSRYDLILAGDVLVYVGDVSELMPAVSRSLRPGGLFAFSIEDHDGTGYALTQGKRFAHSLEYIRQVAAGCKLKEIARRQLVIRKQGDADVPGRIVVLGHGP